MTETAGDDIASLSFEQALAELEKIVSELESGRAELERSIDMYERGARLKAHCEASRRRPASGGQDRGWAERRGGAHRAGGVRLSGRRARRLSRPIL